MAASKKYGEAFDAEYVDNMMGKVLVQACAAVALNKPQDPIEYLSLWLHKYCDNAIILQNYEREKAHKAHKEVKEKEAIMKKVMLEQELRQQQNSTLNYMRSITNDPYLLWDTCLRAITTYTGCQAAYVCVVVRKLFEPKLKKKKKGEGEEREGEEEDEELESELEEEGEGKEGSDATSVDEEPPEADEEKKEGEEGKEGIEAELEPEEEEKEEEPPPPKPFRIPKPLNYKNKRLLYVCATLPSHVHMLNQQMVIKSVPVTFSVLMEGLPDLHIPNVLYKEGIHYFGGCPRVGAYFVAPITVEHIAEKYLAEEFKGRPPEMFDIVKQKQVIALLCCDTLKSDGMGNGRPFRQIEMDFLRDCANTMSSILDENNKEIKKNHNTPEVIEKFKTQLREIRLARVEQMETEKQEAKQRKKAKEKLRRLKRFQVAHKAWEERQEVKARNEARLERQKEKRNKRLEDAGEEIPEEPPPEEPAEGEEAEDDDPEPVLEPDPEEEEELPEGEAPEEPPPEVESEEGEEGEGEEKEEEFKDEELEPNPLAEIEGEGEGDEGEEAEEAPVEEEAEPEEPDEPEEAEVPAAGEEGASEQPNESEDMMKLKARKKAHAKKEKEMKKAIKDLTKLTKGFERRKEKAVAALEKLTLKVEKYERALIIANGVVQYLRRHMENAYNLLMENKFSELERVKRWPYPNRHVQRILKALLYLLGHKKMAIDDWSLARKLFNFNLLDKVLKNYDPVIINDPDRWKDVDSCLVDLKDEKLSKEACIGFLLQQWLLACKKTTNAGVDYHKIKTKYEELSKQYATLKMEKIMSNAETEISKSKLKKLVMDEEGRIDKEVDEIEAEEKRLADLAAEEAIKKEEEDKKYAEYAEYAAQAAEAGEETS